MSAARTALRWLIALFFIAAGANHFREPAVYLGMMPPWLPWPDTMNLISGGAEILGGLGLLAPWAWARRVAGWGLIALLVAIFPANIHVAMLGKMPKYDVSSAVLWWRLAFQPLLVVCVWWVALAKGAKARS